MRTLTLALALGLLADCAGEGVNDGYVRLVLLPDTQCYARFSPVVMEAQARFIQAEQQRTNIVHVAHLGDITDLGTEEEWQRARSALAPLFGQVSMTLVSGNHDLGENGSANTRASRIDSTFAPAELMVSGTFDGGVQNSFTLVEDELLVLGLEFAPRAAVVAWASGVLDAYPERSAIVVTHAYLGPDGKRYDRHADPPQPFGPHDYGIAADGDVHDGEELWQTLISQHANVVLVVSGHVPQGFEVLLSEGAGGHPVVQLMADYQQGARPVTHSTAPMAKATSCSWTCSSWAEDGVGDVRVQLLLAVPRERCAIRTTSRPSADWRARFQQVGSRLMADLGTPPLS
jgi:hypothetical protein